jgi:hypothetical protein
MAQQLFSSGNAAGAEDSQDRNGSQAGGQSVPDAAQGVQSKTE